VDNDFRQNHDIFALFDNLYVTVLDAHPAISNGHKHEAAPQVNGVHHDAIERTAINS